MPPYPPILWRPVSNLTFILLATLGLSPPPAHAASTKEINREVDKALDSLPADRWRQGLLDIAQGVLVFPKAYKAGGGGEYGEGALRVGGKTVDYYSTAAASVGFQPGAQARTIVVLFTSEDALRTFRASEGWKVGVDGFVALIKLGAGEAADTARIKDPMVGFVLGQQGPMHRLTLDGATFTRLKK
ncbi:MAG: YSC84-related protein [Thiobacillus sp.]|nr:YSC84-related protein [Thiobacillus sp.]